MRKGNGCVGVGGEVGEVEWGVGEEEEKEDCGVLKWGEDFD